MKQEERLQDGAEERVWQALDEFAIELPSWGFSNTGTRFGKFLQEEAASTLEEKFADSAEVKRLTGGVSAVALHVLWDMPNGLDDVQTVQALEKKYGIKAGAINPNLFQDQSYKLGSLCNANPEIRQHALDHLLLSIEIAKKLGVRDTSLWLSDGSSYPGTQNIRKRIDWLADALKTAHAKLGPGQQLFVEYKPFEPYFYHTDIADWGMARELCREAGPQAKVLVDTGHHYQGQNIEQIVAWLLRSGLMGGFHFNDRRYADDDLTLGSIDPYAVFRVFYEVLNAAALSSEPLNIAYMIDQSHNMKGKMEAAVQTIVTAQELFARAALIDLDMLGELQEAGNLVEAEELFRGAFWTDVRPLVGEWRKARGASADPLLSLREDGYVERIRNDRRARNTASGGGSYA